MTQAVKFTEEFPEFTLDAELTKYNAAVKVLTEKDA